MASHSHCHSVHRHLALKRKPALWDSSLILLRGSQTDRKIPLPETISGLGFFFFSFSTRNKIVSALGRVSSSVTHPESLLTSNISEVTAEHGWTLPLSPGPSLRWGGEIPPATCEDQTEAAGPIITQATIALPGAAQDESSLLIPSTPFLGGSHVGGVRGASFAFQKLLSF